MLVTWYWNELYFKSNKAAIERSIVSHRPTPNMLNPVYVCSHFKSERQLFCLCPSVFVTQQIWITRCIHKRWSCLYLLINVYLPTSNYSFVNSFHTYLLQYIYVIDGLIFLIDWLIYVLIYLLLYWFIGQCIYELSYWLNDWLNDWFMFFQNNIIISWEEKY